tara:strand:- start:143 stop:421 length:279 start_codon:yes stop_codon:yes gene_type:complete
MKSNIEKLIELHFPQAELLLLDIFCIKQNTISFYLLKLNHKFNHDEDEFIIKLIQNPDSDKGRLFKCNDRTQNLKVRNFINLLNEFFTNYKR